MSRDLPHRPNLDHLKKQAKDLLREMLQQNPRTKLTEAQYVLAREYGFESWPKLRAHIQSLAREDTATAPTTSHSFYRYTPKAREALFFSRYEASQLGSLSIEPEHVLLGLIRASQGLRRPIFEPAQLSLASARSEIARAVDVREPLGSSIMIPLSATSRQALRAAEEEADSLSHHDIGLAHVLLGLLREGRSRARLVLEEKGMRFETLRAGIAEFLGEESPG